MSGGGSKSSSKSETKTTTTNTTEQFDQRVAATDAAVAIGPNTQGSITISQLPDGAGEILSGFIDLTAQALQAAVAGGQAAFDTQAAQIEQQAAASQATAIDWQKYLPWVAGAAVVLILFKGEF